MQDFTHNCGEIYPLLPDAARGTSEMTVRQAMTHRTSLTELASYLVWFL